jgi:hypothetical protein
LILRCVHAVAVFVAAALVVVAVGTAVVVAEAVASWGFLDEKIEIVLAVVVVATLVFVHPPWYLVEVAAAATFLRRLIPQFVLSKDY